MWLLPSYLVPMPSFLAGKLELLIVSRCDDKMSLFMESAEQCLAVKHLMNSGSHWLQLSDGVMIVFQIIHPMRICYEESSRLGRSSV